MSEPQAETVAPEPARDGAGLAFALLCGIALLIGLVALPERLEPDEARLLARLLGPETARTTHPVEQAWSLIVGTMERPSRLLGVLSAGIALLIVLAAGEGMDRTGRACALLGLAATGLFWQAALEIGAGGWALAAGALWLGLLRLVGMPIPAAALLGAALGPLLAVFGPGEAARPWDDLLRLAPTIPAAEIPPALGPGLAAAGATAIVLLAGNRGLLPAAVLAVAVLPSALVALGERDPLPLGPGLAATLPAFGLALGWAVEGAGIRRPALVPLLGMALILSAFAPLALRTSPAPDDRARLEAAARLVPESGWMALLGERAPVLRYYELVGHRVPGRSFLIRDEDEVRALVGAVQLETPPLLLLADPPPEVVTKLEERYRRIEAAEVPDGFVLLLFGRNSSHPR